MKSLLDFKDRYRGRCYVLGNGPSLKDVNLEELQHNSFVFGTNRIYLSGFTPDFYACVNPLVLGQFKDEIADLDSIKFVSGTNGVQIENQKGELYELDTSLRLPAFGSPEAPMWEGFTVTFVALQLAFYMGFEEVVLLGVDHDYGKTYQPNIEVVSTEEDEAHFSPDYFGAGVRWNAPDLAMSEVAYSLAKAAYEMAGKRIVNASASTKLRTFPVETLNHLNHGCRVSAIVSAYKSEAYIEQCIKDLQAQTEPVEIVVVAREKSYEYLKVIEMLGLEPCKLEIVTTPDIPTVYEAWNLGAKAAHGKYLTNANTDDRHHPEAYKTMADILDARPDIDLVYHDQYITWKPNQTYAEYWQENQGIELVSGRWEDRPGIFCWPDYELKTLRQGCYIGPQPMWRANLHQLHGYFEPQYTSAGDYEFWLRCAGEGNYFHIAYPLGLYLARPDGVELGNPILSQEETTSAIYLHQNPDMEFYPLGGKYYRVNLGPEFIVVDSDTIKKWAAWVEERDNAALRIPMPA